MKTSLMDGHQVGVCTGGAQISIGHDKLVVEFPVSGARESLFSCFQFQDIPGKGCFYIFIPTAWSSIHGSGTLLWWLCYPNIEFWTASYLMYTVVSINSIFYMHVFNI